VGSIVGKGDGSAVGGPNGDRLSGHLLPRHWNERAPLILTLISSQDPESQNRWHGASRWQFITVFPEQESRPLQLMVIEEAPLGSSSESVQALLPSQWRVQG